METIWAIVGVVVLNADQLELLAIGAFERVRSVRQGDNALSFYAARGAEPPA